jgi:hypothetical protein
MIEKYKHQIEFLFITAILIIVGTVYFQFLTKISSKYHPVWNDEYLYYVNAKAYFQNNTFQAALTLDGKGSLVFKCDPHGFAYPLTHGTIASICGWHSSNFIWFNFFLIAVSCVLIFYLLPITPTKKISILTIMLLFPFIPLYAFTYMQELIHVFFAVIIGILFYHISQRKNNKILIAIFLITIIIASLFRSLWFFWIIGLLPFANNRRQQIFFLILFILGCLASFTFVKLFMEAFPNYFTTIIARLLDGEIYDVSRSLLMHTLMNVKLYFFSTNNSLVYFSMKFLTAGVIGYFTYLSIKTKDKISIAIMLIGFINFIMLFVFYDANYWREIRTLSPLFYFSMLFLVLKIEKKSTYLLIGVLFALFTLTIKITHQQIKDRNLSINYNKPEHDAYRSIAQEVSKDKIILIKNVPKEDYSFLLYLPLQNKYNQPLRYMLPLYETPFKEYEYILYFPAYQAKGTSVLNNIYYSLYKNDAQ